MVSLWKKQFSELLNLPNVSAIEGVLTIIEYKNENNNVHRPSYIGPASIWYKNNKIERAEYWVNDTRYNSMEEVLFNNKDYIIPF